MPLLPPFCRLAARYSVFRSPPDQKLASKSSEAALVRRINLRFVKMMLQEANEAASRMTSTTCTAKLASITRLRMDISVVIFQDPQTLKQAL
jgi:hypothetical protein